MNIEERNSKYVRFEIANLICIFGGIISLVVLAVSVIAYGVVWPTIVLSWVAAAFFLGAKYFNGKALKYLLWEA